jgi:MoaA/NifB/PqqE/SkfB family radical SAM enzyme
VNRHLRRYASASSYMLRNAAHGTAIWPLYVSLKLSHRCERACPFCDLPRREPVRDADTGAVLRMIDALERSSTFVLCLEGGEPFLRPDIETILAHAARRRPLVSVVTAYPPGCEALRPRLAGWIDFLQISIDEGHGNLDLLPRLADIRRAWGTRVGVQCVVTAADLEALDAKVEAVWRAGCKVVAMPAVDLDGTRLAPPPRRFLEALRRVERRWPRTVVTARAFRRALVDGRPCSTASLIVDPDGSVFYPCRTLGTKPFNLLDGDLNDFLRSAPAAALRRTARRCNRRCGWYQYFAVGLDSWRALPFDVWAALERIL